MVSGIYIAFLVFLYFVFLSIYFTLERYYIILFALHLSFQTTCSRLAKSLFFRSNIVNHNVSCKKIKCKVNLCNVASAQYNYFWMITSKNCLKQIVNIIFLKNCFNFISTANFHRACAYLSLNFRTKKISFQGRSEGTSSVTFEVLIFNWQIYFVYLFIFNCLTLNINLFIINLFDVKF